MRQVTNKRLENLESVAPAPRDGRHCEHSYNAHPCDGDCPGRGDPPQMPQEAWLSWMLQLFSSDLRMTPTGPVGRDFYSWETDEHKARWHKAYGWALTALQSIYEPGMPFTLLSPWAAAQAISEYLGGRWTWRRQELRMEKSVIVKWRWHFVYCAGHEWQGVEAWDKQTQSVGLLQMISNQDAIWQAQNIERPWHRSGDVLDLVDALRGIADGE